jgi:hypothetical protein
VPGLGVRIGCDLRRTRNMPNRFDFTVLNVDKTVFDHGLTVKDAHITDDKGCHHVVVSTAID